ncbi:UNVERIFIED_CONTAM: hypothetical protein GTU68_042397 [Idotea baltica]|nr:hypothetical protein [Idotea baltica]
MYINYKLLTPADITDLKQISVETFTAAFASQNTPDNMSNYLDQAFNEDRLMEELNNPNSSFYFAKDQAKTIGYMKVNVDHAQTDLIGLGGMELERIYVMPSHQGKGVGRHMLDQVLSLARNNQKLFVWLGVWDQNLSAIGFYNKYGFNTIGSHEFMLGSELQTDYIMRVDLV